MTIREILIKFLKEERNIKSGFLDFEVQVGESEGDNIPHFHLDNKEQGNKQKKTAIRLDMPSYFLHGDKKYILNSKERKELVKWLNEKPASGLLLDKNGNYPKTNWQALVNIWNIYYPQATITCNIPNYSILCCDYKLK